MQKLSVIIVCRHSSLLAMCIIIIIIIIIIISYERQSNIIVKNFKVATAEGCRNWVTQKLIIWQVCHQSGNERANSSVFSLRRKMSNDSEDWTAANRLFRDRAADTLNARSPMVECSVRGTSSMVDDDERRRCR